MGSALARVFLSGFNDVSCVEIMATLVVPGSASSSADGLARP